MGCNSLKVHDRAICILAYPADIASKPPLGFGTNCISYNNISPSAELRLNCPIANQELGDPGRSTQLFILLAIVMHRLIADKTPIC